MAVKKVDIPDVGPVSLYKRRGTKSLRLSVTSQGEVRVSLPPWLPYSAATQFVANKQAWIRRHVQPSQTLAHQGRIGKAHRLQFIPDTKRQAVATRIAGSEIRIFHPHQLETTSPEVQKAAARASVRALKSQAQQLLPGHLDTLAQQHGFQYQSVAIKRLTSRWGSCSSEGVIALSCFLMQLPWHLIDYVILHELTHTRVMAHGPPFWQELANYVPNHKAIRQEIKNHRPILLALD